MEAIVDARHPRTIGQVEDSHALSTAPADSAKEVRPAGQKAHGPVPHTLEHLARLEASTGAALALLRRCIVEEEAPTREALAAEAEFAFGLPGEAALAEIDQVAEMVGISSLR